MQAGLNPRARRWTAVVAVLALLSGLIVFAVVSQGYDAQKADPVDTSVWVARKSGQYARVNTQLSQLDSVQKVDDPSAVVQFGRSGVVYTQGFRKQWAIDPAAPAALLDKGDDGQGASGDPTPSGTRQVVAAGDWLAYLTDVGKAFIRKVSAGSSIAPAPVDAVADGSSSSPSANGEQDPTAATAVTVDDQGLVALYSAGDHSVRMYDGVLGRRVGDAVALSSPPPPEAKVQLVLVAGSWALLDPATGRLWMKGRQDPLDTKATAAALLQQSSSAGDRVLIADSSGLLGVNLSQGGTDRIVSAQGTPAVPVQVEGTTYAAWVGQRTARLWSSDGGDRELTVPAGVLDKVREPAPVIASNGHRGVLEETASGQLWALPDGSPIPVGQWEVQQQKNEKQSSESLVQEPTKPEPPVARNSSFGVRAGSTVNLPVLLNAYSPMKNAALSIVPSSLPGQLNAPGFGELSLSSDNQQVVARISARSGKATFTYVVTDGQLKSAPATVTLTVVPASVTADPVWCGIESCMQNWPRPELAPGGTVTVPVMDAWVDPSGDAMVLTDVRKDDPGAPIRVVATAHGDVVVRHTDPNAPAGDYGVSVTVSDSAGRSSTKQLTVHVGKDAPVVTTAAVVVTGTGQPKTVDVLSHVTGGSGTYRLLDAAISQGAKNKASATPNGSAGTVRLVSDAAGEYVVGYTVQDVRTQGQASGVLRFSVVDTSSALGMPALTAFVRPQQDTTLDVLSAVQNSSGKVLALVSATPDNARLSADVVDNDQLRVSGSALDEKTGLVGKADVVVGDGAGASLRGVVSVFLVPATSGIAPIARPDAVTVRAGTQVDIPVTANDAAPRGERLVLHPTLHGSGAPGELAFVSGDKIRYLAPSKPGSYTLSYSEYLESDPSRMDGATVTITVVGDSGNHSPEPPVLSARAVTGGNVLIPVPSSGIDADGDSTVVTDVTQPGQGQGSATVSADGTAITYRAPGRGTPGGQISFRYTVKDSHGATASADVRVAVLSNQQTAVAPVTFTDSVSGVKNSTEPVTVQPLLNDRDPAGGRLSLVSLEPNAGSGSPEYQRLKSLIDPGSDLKAGTVRLRPGAVEGVQSYFYTAKSATTSSTAQGLIVMTVAPDPAPDVPQVKDTVVSMGDRSRLSDGLDVISGKVSWPSGDPGTLTLSVWGDAAKDYSVHGHSISGPAPTAGALVPFQISGKDRLGRAATGFGFLRIPAFNDMRLQLAAQLPDYRVPEGDKLQMNVADVVDLGPRERAELRQGMGFDVQRAHSSCSAVSDKSVEYAAGRGAPWTDTCTLLVRAPGQDSYTSLPVPVMVVPKDPEPLMNSMARTIAPGTSQTIDFYGEMTSWDGGRAGNATSLAYQMSYSGSNFQVVQNGRSVTVTARADAHQGARDSAVVSLPRYAGLSATLTLVVGSAPPDAPRGATFSQSCAANGASCVFPVVGVSGEYDPFKGKDGAGLKLLGLGATSCTVAQLSMTGENSVAATFAAAQKPPGGNCRIPFTVADAQGRTGSGSVNLDVQGFPAPLSSLTTTAFTGSSVTLSVTLGDAALAHPALSGVEILEKGQPVGASCAPAGGIYSCTVAGLRAGQQHSYTARAINSTGESKDTFPVTTWAYASPAVGGGQASTVYLPGQTNQSQGVIQLDLSAAEDVSAFQVSVDGQARATVPRSGSSTRWTGGAAPGQHTIQVVPVSRFQPPMGQGNSGTAWQTSVTVAGSPVLTSSGRLTTTSDSSMTLAGAAADGNSSPQGITARYAIWQAGQSMPDCTAQGGPWQSSAAFGGLQPYRTYQAAACFSNGFGTVASSPVTATLWPGSPPDTASYTVATNPKTGTVNGFTTSASYGLQPGPGLKSKLLLQILMTVNGQEVRYSSDADFRSNLSADTNPGTITYRYCFAGQSSNCGQPSPITPTTAPTLVNLAVSSDPVKEADVKDTDVTVSAAARGSVKVVSTVDTTKRVVTYHVTFEGAFASLSAVDLTRPLAVPIVPNPVPTPTRTP